MDGFGGGRKNAPFDYTDCSSDDDDEVDLDLDMEKGRPSTSQAIKQVELKSPSSRNDIATTTSLVDTGDD